MRSLVLLIGLLASTVHVLAADPELDSNLHPGDDDCRNSESEPSDVDQPHHHVIARDKYESLTMLCEYPSVFLKYLPDHIMEISSGPELNLLASFCRFTKRDQKLRFLIASFCKFTKKDNKIHVYVKDDLYEVINGSDRDIRLEILYSLSYINVNNDIQSHIINRCGHVISQDLLHAASLSYQHVSEYLVHTFPLRQHDLLRITLFNNLELNDLIMELLLSAIPPAEFPNILSDFVIYRRQHSASIPWNVFGRVMAQHLNMIPFTSGSEFVQFMLQSIEDQISNLSSFTDYQHIQTTLLFSAIYISTPDNFNDSLYKLIDLLTHPDLKCISNGPVFLDSICSHFVAVLGDGQHNLEYYSLFRLVNDRFCNGILSEALQSSSFVKFIIALDKLTFLSVESRNQIVADHIESRGHFNNFRLDLLLKSLDRSESLAVIDSIVRSIARSFSLNQNHLYTEFLVHLYNFALNHDFLQDLMFTLSTRYFSNEANIYTPFFLIQQCSDEFINTPKNRTVINYIFEHHTIMFNNDIVRTIVTSVLQRLTAESLAAVFERLLSSGGYRIFNEISAGWSQENAREFQIASLLTVDPHIWALTFRTQITEQITERGLHAFCQSWFRHRNQNSVAKCRRAVVWMLWCNEGEQFLQLPDLLDLLDYAPRLHLLINDFGNFQRLLCYLLDQNPQTPYRLSPFVGVVLRSDRPGMFYEIIRHCYSSNDDFTADQHDQRRLFCLQLYLDLVQYNPSMANRAICRSQVAEAVDSSIVSSLLRDVLLKMATDMSRELKLNDDLLLTISQFYSNDLLLSLLDQNPQLPYRLSHFAQILRHLERPENFYEIILHCYNPNGDLTADLHDRRRRLCLDLFLDLVKCYGYMATEWVCSSEIDAAVGSSIVTSLLRDALQLMATDLSRKIALKDYLLLKFSQVYSNDLLFSLFDQNPQLPYRFSPFAQVLLRLKRPEMFYEIIRHCYSPNGELTAVLVDRRRRSCLDLFLDLVDCDPEMAAKWVCCSQVVAAVDSSIATTLLRDVLQKMATDLSRPLKLYGDLVSRIIQLYSKDLPRSRQKWLQNISVMIDIPSNRARHLVLLILTKFPSHFVLNHFVVIERLIREMPLTDFNRIFASKSIFRHLLLALNEEDLNFTTDIVQYIIENSSLSVIISKSDFLEILPKLNQTPLRLLSRCICSIWSQGAAPQSATDRAALGLVLITIIHHRLLAPRTYPDSVFVELNSCLNHILNLSFDERSLRNYQLAALKGIVELEKRSLFGSAGYDGFYRLAPSYMQVKNKVRDLEERICPLEYSAEDFHPEKLPFRIMESEAIVHMILRLQLDFQDESHRLLIEYGLRSFGSERLVEIDMLKRLLELYQRTDASWWKRILWFKPISGQVRKLLGRSSRRAMENTDVKNFFASNQIFWFV